MIEQKVGTWKSTGAGAPLSRGEQGIIYTSAYSAACCSCCCSCSTASSSPFLSSFPCSCSSASSSQQASSMSATSSSVNLSSHDADARRSSGREESSSMVAIREACRPWWLLFAWKYGVGRVFQNIGVGDAGISGYAHIVFMRDNWCCSHIVGIGIAAAAKLAGGATYDTAARTSLEAKALGVSPRAILSRTVGFDGMCCCAVEVGSVGKGLVDVELPEDCSRLLLPLLWPSSPPPRPSPGGLARLFCSAFLACLLLTVRTSRSA